MAWTTPRTWTTGEAVTSAILNTHIRDQFNAMSAEPHECWLKRTSAATISNTTLTAISWQAADRNVGEMWTSGTDVTIQETGLYAVTVNVQWENTGSGYAHAAIGHDDGGGFAVVAGTGDDASFGNNNISQRSTHTALEMSAGHKVRGYAYQNSGGDLDIQSSQGAGVSLKVVQVQRRLL